MRPLIQVYDAKQALLTSEGGGGAYVDMIDGVYDGTNARYATSDNLAAVDLRPVVVRRSEVKFIRVGCFSSVGGFVRNFTASMPFAPLGREKSKAAAQGAPQMVTLDGSPTRGWGPVNTSIFNRTAKRTEWVSFIFELTVNGALSAGATTLTVAAIGFAGNGDIYSVLLDNGDTLTGVISGTSGNSFTISAVPTGRSIANGTRVAVCRWAF
jgi:hypothetical protein